MPGAQAQRRGSRHKNTPWHARGADEGGYTSASDSVESGSCFSDVLWTRSSERSGAELVPQPGAIQHHGNISYILQAKADLQRRADWSTLCSLCDSVRLIFWRLLAKASVVLRKTPLFQKALLLEMHEWGVGVKPIYTKHWALILRPVCATRFPSNLHQS